MISCFTWASIILSQDELARLKPEFERLISENNKLVQDLRKTVENQLGGASDGEFSPSNDQEQILQNLQMQAESALQVWEVTKKNK